MMLPVYEQTTLMIHYVLHAFQHTGGVRGTGDVRDGGHVHALARIADYYLHGEGAKATAAARVASRTRAALAHVHGWVRQAVQKVRQAVQKEEQAQLISALWRRV